MCKSFRHKLEEKLTEYKKYNYKGSFICKECNMYNEYVEGTPILVKHDIMIEYKCKNCGKIHYTIE